MEEETVCKETIKVKSNKLSTIPYAMTGAFDLVV